MAELKTLFQAWKLITEKNRKEKVFCTNQVSSDDFKNSQDTENALLELGGIRALENEKVGKETEMRKKCKNLLSTFTNKYIEDLITDIPFDFQERMNYNKKLVTTIDTYRNYLLILEKENVKHKKETQALEENREMIETELEEMIKELDDLEKKKILRETYWTTRVINLRCKCEIRSKMIKKYKFGLISSNLISIYITYFGLFTVIKQIYNVTFGFGGWISSFF